MRHRAEEASRIEHDHVGSERLGRLFAHGEHLLELRATPAERLPSSQAQLERRHLFLQLLNFLVSTAQREVAVPDMADAAEHPRGADRTCTKCRRTAFITLVPCDVSTCMEIRTIGRPPPRTIPYAVDVEHNARRRAVRGWAAVSV